MDRYPDLAAYAAAKQRVYAGEGIMVLNQDDPLVAAMQQPGRLTRWFGLGSGSVGYGVQTRDGEEWMVTPSCSALLKSAELRIKGRHNLANALAAVALADAVGIGVPAMVTTLKRFPGLDHRMQWVAEIAQVVWINDSKATNVGACLAALQGLDGKAVLIAGGDGKGADFSILREVVARKVRSAVLMGKDAALLEQALRDVVDTVRVSDMKQAVKTARTLARPGDTVLLAPACASLDQYRDFQERGRLFADAVRSLPV
jgi:UDP-N-acetylmuramoylalanine--D-glutamate ligase